MRIRLNVVRSVHGVYTTLGSGVVSIVAKFDVINTTIRHCARSYRIRLPVVLTVDVVKPHYTRVCRESRWRPYDTLCAFV